MMIAGSGNMQNTAACVSQRVVISLAIAGVFAAAAGFVVTARAQNTGSGDPASGKKIYLADGCFMCHGRAGQGGGFNYPTPAIAQLEMPEESFIAFLREAPRDMPTYSKAVLSDKEAGDIYAFLHSLPGRKSPKDFPLLNN
jgi:mono/diheme cytochrome c family protein